MGACSLPRFTLHKKPERLSIFQLNDLPDVFYPHIGMLHVSRLLPLLPFGDIKPFSIVADINMKPPLFSV